MNTDKTSSLPQPAADIVQSPPAWAPADFLSLLMVLMVLVGGAMRFLPFQSLWVDEATQLRGLQLGPAKVAHWLAGGGPTLDVPPDRAPPLSYWLGQLWSGAAGGGEMALRVFGVICVAAGAVFYYTAARRAYGRRAATLSALLLGLSVNILITAVEIRSYPILFLLGCCGLYLLVRYLQNPSPQWLALLTLTCIAAIYTHFFGLVLAGAMFLSLLIVQRPRRPIVIAIIAIIVASVGLLPFVVGALGQTGNPAKQSGPASGAARLVYRLLGHPALGVSMWATVGMFTGAAVLLVAALLKPLLPSLRNALLIMLGAGLVVVIAARVALPKFDALSPHYNIWMIPALLLLLAGGLRNSGRLWASLAALAMLLASLSAQVQLMRHPMLFSHGPQRWIAGKLLELGPADTAVIYDAPDAMGGHVAYPLRYYFGDTLSQYQAGPGGQIGPWDQPHAPAADPARLQRHYVMVLQTQSLSAHGQAEAWRGKIRPIIDGPAATRLLNDPHWALLDNRQLSAAVGADVLIFARQ